LNPKIHALWGWIFYCFFFRNNSVLKKWQSGPSGFFINGRIMNSADGLKRPQLLDQGSVFLVCRDRQERF
jgi:hypothetical protein